MEKARNVDIRQFYREDLGVHSEKLLDKLEAVSQAVTLQKGEILNKKGERQTMLPFLIEGMMRCVTLDREGKEKTVGFTMSRGDGYDPNAKYSMKKRIEYKEEKH